MLVELGFEWDEEVYTGWGRRVSECRRKGGKIRKGTGMVEGGKGRQDLRLISYPCIVQKENRELGEVWRSKSCTRVPLNESPVNERKMLGGC